MFSTKGSRVSVFSARRTAELSLKGALKKPVEAGQRIVAAGQSEAVIRGGRIRPVADDVNQPAEGVAPEQRALRSAQHFDAVHIHKACQGLSVARTVEAVGVEGNGDIVGLYLLGAGAARNAGRGSAPDMPSCKPGASISSRNASVMPKAFNSSPDTAVTATDTSCRL